MKRQCNSIGPMQHAARYRVAASLLACLTVLLLAVAALADIPGRRTPAGTSVPNPGTQQQELPNITFPAPYNVFEFPVTCMACHGGTIDQQAGHGGNWAGSNMASSMRDPVFRANQILTNDQVKAKTGQDGAGNLCMRCHSPNGWYSGRFDPLLGGAADGSTAEHSILLSTDDEGISCEFCHRAIGAVTMKRPDLDQNDPVWNMLSGVLDWPHLGNPYPAGPVAGNPYGDATLQINDVMSYGGKYGGNTEMSFSDALGFYSETGAFPSGTYTGQTYGIYPLTYTGPRNPPPPGMPKWNVNGEELAYNPDGSLSIAFEKVALPGDLWGSVSPEHSTRRDDFVLSPEFCGSCHNVTIPVLNHGMPEQRTYTEWKYSSFADPAAVKPDGTPYYKRCQDCHMPTLMHEYADSAPVSLNPDPLLAGWYPYAKDRNTSGGTTFHKFNGANRNLPMMMKVLYPEVDLEVVGAPTGRDTRIFPGLQSSRDFTWDREQRNTELSLRDTANVQITSGPAYNALTGLWEVKVKVTNNTGHKIPSGYPDGRRIWLGLNVKDATGAVVYQSGAYDPATATLSNDSTTTALTRARTTTINSASNAVMIYEKRTGSANPDGSYAMSVSLLNEAILFDNRIPPAGFTYAPYAAEGAKFWNYMGNDGAATPFEEASRYPDGQNWDEVTYTFSAPSTATLTARAELYYQSQTREHMEFLKDNDTSTLRPEGPPSILAPNYPLTPTYLSDSLTDTTGVLFADLRDFNNQPLNDNWGGVAFAAWLQTGMGAPFAIAADDTAVAAAPAAPTGVTTTVFDPFAIDVSWNPVAGAEGYIVWVRYGLSDTTASWDRLALVPAGQTTFRNDGLNVAKTYAYKVQAFNAKGASADSMVVTQSTPTDLPLPPENLQVVTVTDTTVTLAWFDVADNETGFIIERQDVPEFTNQPWPAFVEIARIPSQTAGGAFGGNNFTDTGLLPGRTYNYRVAAFNASGPSIWNINGPVAATTLGPPPAPSALAATAVNANQVDLSWTDNSGSELGFQVERSLDGITFAPLATVGANVTTYSDSTTLVTTTYHYRVKAFNAVGVSAPSNTATVTTPSLAPAAPSNAVATPSPFGPNPPTVTLTWTDNSLDETGFIIHRATDPAFAVGLNTFPVGADITSFLDTTVEPKTTYYYRVFAVNAAGSSLPSNTASAITAGEVPQPPANLIIGKTTKNSVSMSWVDNANNESGFYIERSPNGTAGWTRVGTVGPNVTTFTNTGLSRKTTYWYRVQAYNADGVSAYTDPPVSGTTK